MADLPAFLNGENPEYGAADENGFVGVSPEYANFANDTDAPLEGSEDEAPAEEEAPVEEEAPANEGDNGPSSNNDVL